MQAAGLREPQAATRTHKTHSYAVDEQQSNTSENLPSFHIFVRQDKNEWNPNRQHFVSDANPRLKARWHDALFTALPFVRTKGNTNRRQAESNHARMNCRGAKEENKRSAVKNRRGETIEIASAAGEADACVFCGSSEPRSSPPPHCGGLLSHSDRRRRTASNIVIRPDRGLRRTQRCECRCGPPLSGGCGPRDAEASHSTAAPPCPMQTEQASPKREYPCI